jgi:hypothetical protein
MLDYQKLYEDCVARLANTQASLENETAARTAAEAELARVSSVLHLHQQAADAITAGASGILNNNSLTADQKLAGLGTALAKAAEFASGREKTRLEAEAAQLRQEAAAKQAEADAIAE